MRDGRPAPRTPLTAPAGSVPPARPRHAVEVIGACNNAAGKYDSEWEEKVFGPYGRELARLVPALGQRSFIRSKPESARAHRSSPGSPTDPRLQLRTRPPRPSPH